MSMFFVVAAWKFSSKSLKTSDFSCGRPLVLSQSSLDGVVTVAYVRLLRGKHCEDAERNKVLKMQQESFKEVWKGNL